MNVRTILTFFVLVFAAALGPADAFTSGSFAECCWAAALDDVRVSIFDSTVAEPASMTLFGIGLSLVAVRCRATRDRKLVRMGQSSGVPTDGPQLVKTSFHERRAAQVPFRQSQIDPAC